MRRFARGTEEKIDRGQPKNEKLHPGGDQVIQNVDAKRQHSRRDVLQLLGAAGLIAVFNESCTITETIDMTEEFTNNFNPYDYRDCQFGEGELTEVDARNRQKMSAENCRFGFKMAIDEDFSYKIDLDDLVVFKDVGGKITASGSFDTLEGRAAFMQKYPYVRSINAIKSPAYSYNYILDTGKEGYIYVSLSDNAFHLWDQDAGSSVAGCYNLDSSDLEMRSDYKDFQRNIMTRKKVNGTYVQRHIWMESDGAYLDQKIGAVQSYTCKDGNRALVHETSTYADFLKKCRSNPLIRELLLWVDSLNSITQASTGKLPEAVNSIFSFTNIKSINELIEIFRLMPPDPELQGLLVSDVLRSHAYDQTVKDEYRDPVTTLQSGWADCDDFAVINYFWAYLHRLEPNMCVIKNSRTGVHHVFVWYVDDKKRFVALDNGTASAGKMVDLQDYLSKYSNNALEGVQRGDQWEVQYNGPIPPS